MMSLKSSWAVAVLVFSSLAACASLEKNPQRPELWPEVRTDYRVESLRASLREYSINFAAGVELAATAIERRATDAAVKRNALVWRLRTIPEIRHACFRPEPVAGLIDAWTFALQMDRFFREGPGSTAFGAFQSEALEVSGRLVAEIRALSGSIAVSPEARVELERRIIEPWVVEHPLRDIAFVRESPIARLADQVVEGGDVLQSVGTIEEMVSSLSQQARVYMADLPRQVRGEIDLLRSDVLPPERVSSMQDDLHLAATAAESIAATAGTLAGLVAQERQLVLDDVSRQRALVLSAISLERQLAVDAVSRTIVAEREQLLRDVDAQRRATLAWATSERREALSEMGRELTRAIHALREERTAALNDMRHIVDIVLLRIALGIVACVVLAPVVAHAYARVWPRR